MLEPTACRQGCAPALSGAPWLLAVTAASGAAEAGSERPLPPRTAEQACLPPPAQANTFSVTMTTMQLGEGSFGSGLRGLHR